MTCRTNLSNRLAALVSLTLLLGPNAGYAAQDSGEVAERLRAEVAQAVMAGDEAALKGMVALAQRAVTALPEDALLHHYLGYALYRLGTLTFGSDPDGARALMGAAETALRRSIELDPIPESYALMSSVLGRQIVDDATAMLLAPRAGIAMDRATVLGPDNPRVKVLEGIRAFHTPPMFGGGHDIALDRFRAAAALFEEDAPEPPLPSWGHAEAYAWLGQTYVELDMPEEARAAYERALEIEPTYAWVRDELLPALSP